MQRYFIDSNSIYGNNIKVTNSDLHHIKNVMRFRLLDKATFVDPRGTLFTAELKALEKHEALFEIIHQEPYLGVLSHITIAQALIKRERFELFLEKSTELGVYEIIPTVFERSIIKISQDDEDKKIERYRLITKEASEQSERRFLPLINAFQDLKKIDTQKYDLVLVCYERDIAQEHIHKVVIDSLPSQRILVFIGPEGGISPAEIAYFESINARFVSLGKQILRSETASMVVLSSFLSGWEL